MDKIMKFYIRKSFHFARQDIEESRSTRFGWR